MRDPDGTLIIPAPERLADLYEADETAWLDAMATLIRDGRRDDLDFDHLREYLDDMAGRDRREVQNRLIVLIAHLLKWTHQPGRRSKSWRRTVLVQRLRLARLLKSGTLRNHAEFVLAEVYADGVRLATEETGLPPENFPSSCPYTLDQIEGYDFFAD